MTGVQTWALPILTSAPLSVEAIRNDNTPDQNVIRSGIKWKTEFSDTEITLYNRTGIDFKNFSSFIDVDRTIVGIGQKSTLPNCYFTALGLSLQAQPVHNAIWGTVVNVKSSLVGTDSGYMLHCDNFPANSGIVVEIATARINETHMLVKHFPRNPLEARDTILGYDFRSMHQGQGWFGDPDGDVYIRDTDPTKVHVDARFVARFKPFHTVATERVF